MFCSKTVIANTDLKSQAGVRGAERCQTDQREPANLPGSRAPRSVRAMLMAAGLLCGANILSMQMVSPAFAKATKAAAAAAAATAEAEAADAAAKEERRRNSYERRKASVLALLDSGKKFDSEHQTTHAEFAIAESMVNEAEALAAAKKYNDAKERLDRAYTLLKNTMRDSLGLKDVSASAKGAAGAVPKAAAAPASDEKKKMITKRWARASRR